MDVAYQTNPSISVTHGHFFAIVEILCKTDASISSAKVISLMLYKLGDYSQQVRKHALRLLRNLESHGVVSEKTATFEISILSPLSTTFKQAQEKVSASIAEKHPDLSHDVISELMSRLVMVDRGGRRDLFYCVLPWLANITLSVEEVANNSSSLSTVLLSNMFYATAVFGDDHETEIELAWGQLTLTQNNLKAVLEFLFLLGSERKCSVFASFAKKIILFIGRTRSRDLLIGALMADLTPRSLVPGRKQRKSRLGMTGIISGYVAPLLDILPLSSRKSGLSRGQLLLLLLVDSVLEYGVAFANHFPALILLALVQLDHFNPFIREHSRMLLISVIKSIDSQGDGDVKTDLIQKLTAAEGKVLWQVDTSNKKQISFPDELKNIVAKVRDLCDSALPEFSQIFGELSANWATSCPVRHVACRSLQIYRIVQPKFTQRIFSDFLARLSNTISDVSPDVQGFALEILTTLSSAVRRLQADQLSQYPQLFWACAAAMQSCNVLEFKEALNVIKSMLETLDWTRSELYDVLIAHQPPSMISKFDGVQPLVLKGLSSSVTESLTLEVLQRLITLRNDSFVDASGGRWLFAMLAHLPRFLHSLDAKTSAEFSKQLSACLPQSEFSAFSRLFDSYQRHPHRGKDDFMKSFVSLVRDNFTGSEARIFEFLTMIIKNTDEVYRGKGLQLLKCFFGGGRSSQTTLSQISYAAIRQLFCLTMTGHADDARDLIDVVIRAWEVAPSSQSRALLGNKAILKMTKDLSSVTSFGDVSDDWDFEDAASHSTRTDINSVVSSFVLTTAISTPDIKQDRRPLVSSTAHYEINDYSELVSTLQDLDDFFTDDVETFENEPLHRSQSVSSRQSSLSEEDQALERGEYLMEELEAVRRNHHQQAGGSYDETEDDEREWFAEGGSSSHEQLSVEMLGTLDSLAEPEEAVSVELRLREEECNLVELIQSLEEILGLDHGALEMTDWRDGLLRLRLRKLSIDRGSEGILNDWHYRLARNLPHTQGPLNVIDPAADIVLNAGTIAIDYTE
jgi:hypothetical protein